jgi:hypothetical protein
MVPKKKIQDYTADAMREAMDDVQLWSSLTIFTLIGGACVPSVITFGTPRLASIT